jgi:hypothetical protein
MNGTCPGLLPFLPNSGPKEVLVSSSADKIMSSWVQVYRPGANNPVTKHDTLIPGERACSLQTASSRYGSARLDRSVWLFRLSIRLREKRICSQQIRSGMIIRIRLLLPTEYKNLQTSSNKKIVGPRVCYAILRFTRTPIFIHARFSFLGTSVLSRCISASMRFVSFFTAQQEKKKEDVKLHEESSVS